MSRLEEIRKRCENASEGPWVSSEMIGDEYVSNADAAFIAHARDDVPWLLARIEELEADLVQAEYELDAALQEALDSTP